MTGPRALLRHPMERVALRGRVMAPWRLSLVGARSIVDRPTYVLGEHHMALGDDVLILRGAWLAVESPAWGRPAPAMRIGNRVGIRTYCVISATESVTIEDDVILGAFTSIIDSDHTFALGRPNVMHNPIETAPIRVGRGTWLAERVAVLKGSNIGRCCIVGANSVVRGEIPDFSIAVGSPARVVGQVEGVDLDSPPATGTLW